MNKSGLGKKNKKEEKPKSSVQLRHTYKAQTGRQHVRAVYRQMAQQPKSSTNRRRQQQLIGRWIREDEDDETASETFTCTCGARYKSATELEATPHSLSTKRTHGAHFFTDTEMGNARTTGAGSRTVWLLYLYALGGGVMPRCS